MKTKELEAKMTNLNELFNYNIYHYGDDYDVSIKENKKGKLYLSQGDYNITDDFIEQLEENKKEIDETIEALKKLGIIKGDKVFD